MLSLRKAGHRDLERYYSLLEIDYDKRELLSKLAIHRALTKGEQELLIFFDEESKLDVAYALVSVRSLYGYVLLKYFGVIPWYRGHNLGVEAMRLLNRRYADRQGIIAELTVFDKDDTDTLRKLRRFFERFGYERQDVDYRLGGAPVTLMVKPLKGPADIAPVAHRIIRDFYGRLLSPVGMEKMVQISAKR